MSAFSSLAGSLIDTLKGAAGVAVTFHRGGSSVAVTAIPGQSVVDTADANGGLIQSTTADWIVKAADLVLDGEVVTPARGDTITRGGVTYEMFNPPYKPMDGSGVMLRIYSKKVRE